MVMNMAANMLGLGNAATPLGLKAMEHLDELNPSKGTATNSMCTFLAINTSSVTLIPATAIGLLAAQGIAEPYAIVGTTIGATLCSTIVAIIAVKTFERMPVFHRETAASVVAKEEAFEYEVKPKGISAFGKMIPAKSRPTSQRITFPNAETPFGFTSYSNASSLATTGAAVSRWKTGILSKVFTAMMATIVEHRVAPIVVPTMAFEYE